MRRALVVLPLLAAASIVHAARAKVPEGSEPGQRIPPFTADGTVFTEGGKTATVKIASRKTKRPTAYVFLGTHCPTTARYLTRLAALETEYARKIDFVYLYPNVTDPPAQKLSFHQQHALRGPMVDDQGARIAKLLGGQRTAELVLAGKDGVIVYWGAIDDNKDETQVKRKHFDVAAQEHLAGKPVSQPKAIGHA